MLRGGDRARGAGGCGNWPSYVSRENDDQRREDRRGRGLSEGPRSQGLQQGALRPDVAYESPLTPKLSGERAINFLKGLFPIIKGVEIKQHVVEGDHVATIFDLETERGITAVFDCFRVEDGQLKEIRPFYDPSLLRD